MSNIYTEERKNEIRGKVSKAKNISEALDILTKVLGVSRDTARHANKKHEFWSNLRLKVFGNNVFADKLSHNVQKIINDRLKHQDARAGTFRRLFLDIEVSPNQTFAWRTGYKINLDYASLIKERAIICVCWKWEGEKRVYSLRWDKDQNDRSMLEKIIPVIESADEIVGHAISRFDWPWLKTRSIFHSLPPFREPKIIDSLNLARRKFYFNSNRLDYLGQFLGVGGKLKTGFDLWRDIILYNDVTALNKLVTYCGRDVELLEDVFHKLETFSDAKTNVAVLMGKPGWASPYTGSTNVHCTKTDVTAKGTIRKQMRDKTNGRFYNISESAYQDYLIAKKRD